MNRRPKGRRRPSRRVLLGRCSRLPSLPNLTFLGCCHCLGRPRSDAPRRDTSYLRIALPWAPSLWKLHVSLLPVSSVHSLGMVGPLRLLFQKPTLQDSTTFGPLRMAGSPTTTLSKRLTPMSKCESSASVSTDAVTVRLLSEEQTTSSASRSFHVTAGAVGFAAAATVAAVRTKRTAPRATIVFLIGRILVCLISHSVTCSEWPGGPFTPRGRLD
jgi:hypothetical protein